MARDKDRQRDKNRESDRRTRGGKGRQLSSRDILKHTCKAEVERTVMEPGKPKVTYLRCKTCHVSMGTK